ncbi:MAG: sigma-70 family RNA polymerase sigma factor [Acidobacteria bacterium]|nr:sigma-70 family RNA polymerase sigma factor [Acidobacteriota bacterium]
MFASRPLYLRIPCVIVTGGAADAGRSAALAFARDSAAVVLKYLCFWGPALEPREDHGSEGTPAWQAQLARRISGGDRTAEEQFVQSYFRRLLVFARAKIRQEDAARDLVQDVFLACLKALRNGQLRHEERLDAFVLSTARNMALLYFRSIGPRRCEVELAGDFPAPECLAQSENDERKTLVDSALKLMHPMDQEVLTLSLVEGWKPGQIAGKLGLSSETVRQRKSRAVRRISEILRVRPSRTTSEGNL